MTQPTSAMAAEIAEIPAAAARFLDRESSKVAALGRRLRELDPPVVLTCARGSSDNAAAYFKYVTEIALGVPVASIGPSIASVYEAPLRLKGAAIVSVSQSGKSPDIVALQAAARQAGAFAIAVVNQADSPLAAGADLTLPLHAGEERSVAATKSCLVSGLVLAAIVAEWRDEARLRDAVRAMPAALAQAVECDWNAALPVFRSAESAYAIGRGPSFPIAAEAALKLKETAVLHAEAFSGAEVMHGPLQLLGDGFPVLAFRQNDASSPAMDGAIDRLRAAGGKVFVADATGASGGDILTAPATGHGLLDPLALLAAFYRLAEQVARVRGHDPDRPSHLRKVTETI